MGNRRMTPASGSGSSICGIVFDLQANGHVRCFDLGRQSNGRSCPNSITPVAVFGEPLPALIILARVSPTGNMDAAKRAWTAFDSATVPQTAPTEPARAALIAEIAEIP
jgi:hypothetical protein